jgi:hypothetical protein
MGYKFTRVGDCKMTDGLRDAINAAAKARGNPPQVSKKGFVGAGTKSEPKFNFWKAGITRIGFCILMAAGGLGGWMLSPMKAALDEHEAEKKKAFRILTDKNFSLHTTSKHGSLGMEYNYIDAKTNKIVSISAFARNQVKSELEKKRAPSSNNSPAPLNP